jgi:GT2 family glycosyltransferase
VIIPVFNQAALTAQCLHAVQELDPCDQVVVVDDASTDSTPAVLAGFGNKIKVVTHTQNLGFAASCNHGAEQATGEFLVFLNNDTVPQAGWLEALVRYAEAHPRAGVVGSKLIYPDGTIQHAGVVIGQDRFPRHIYSGFPAEHPAVNKSRCFQIVTAACVLFRLGVFQCAGGFDTGFRNGFEDVDLCLRLGENGCEIHYCAESVVQHLESVSPGRFGHDRNNVARFRELWLDRVRPDDLDYYVQDDLLHLTYEGRYPIIAEFSPLLATLDGAARVSRLEDTVRRQSRQLAELRRENTRLSLELGARMQMSPELEYQQLRRGIRDTVRRLVPIGATVLVTSKGDGALLDLPARRGWHFPQTERGAYAGHHPANDADAIAELEGLRAKGAAYLLIPATSLWWLDFYRAFRQHLETHYVRLATPKELCVLYELTRSVIPAGSAFKARRGSTFPRPVVREQMAIDSEVSWA